MKKLSFKRISYLLHLWLGMASGIVVFIVAITGCIYTFQTELRNIFQPDQYIEIQNKPFLSPSELKDRSMQYVYTSPADSSNVIYGVTYTKQNKAATVAYNHHEDGYTLLVLNPYSGDYISKQVLKNDFFRFILAGHRNLWLPYPIGHQIVGWAVLVFVIILITGIVLWIPKKWNKKSLRPRLTIKKKAGFFRFNYDLHNVLGIYAALIALIIALTGLTWSFEWYANSYYKVVSGGGEFKKWQVAQSDTTAVSGIENAKDILWSKMRAEYPIGTEGSFIFDFPNKNTDTYRIGLNSANNDTYYKRHFRFFDQYTLKELEGGGMYGIRYEDSSVGDKIYRMTYDIHVGAIGGFAGKLLVFFASLITASLPITGFILWWKKRRKHKVA